MFNIEFIVVIFILVIFNCCYLLVLRNVSIFLIIGVSVEFVKI